MPKREKGVEQSASYMRLAPEPPELDGGRAPKGFVPVIVGPEPASTERFLVRVNRFKDPRVATLLQKAEVELGCRQHGVLRLTCDAEYFRGVVGSTSKV